MTPQPPEERPPTNYRQTRRNQDRTLVILVMAVLVVVGTLLIGLVWGPSAAITGGLCLVVGAAFIGGLWLLLSLLERWVED
jgi:hypothetical protein